MSGSVTDKSTEAVVSLCSISKSFGGVGGVRDLSLELRQGEFFSLLGPSGCGKTTTLRMIAGFERPDTGAVRIKGRDVTSAPPNRRPVNTVFQSYALFSHLNVGENVEFGLRERHVPRAQRIAAVREALALVRLSGYENRRIQGLSGGEQQRIALARAIVNQPEVLLLDEPLGALDLKLRRAMQEELKALQQRLGMTFLYVTHDQEEALLMSDRIGIMKAGRLEQVGTAEELYDRPATGFVADFVGEANILPAQVVGVDGDGRVTVRLANNQVVNATCDRDPVPGTRGALILRPEKIAVMADNDHGSRPRLSGTVQAIYFVGTFRRFVIDLGMGMKVTVVAANAGPVTVEPGSRVELTSQVYQAWFLAGELAFPNPEGRATTETRKSRETDHGHDTTFRMARGI